MKHLKIGLVVVCLAIVLLYIFTKKTMPPLPPAISPSTNLVTFTLLPQNNSGQNGNATFKNDKNDVLVRIDLPNNPFKTDHPSHIHYGTCSRLGKVKYPLTRIKDNSSETRIDDITVYELLSFGPLSLNVHRSDEEFGLYTSCADLVK